MKPLEEMTDQELAQFTDDLLGHDKSIAERDLNSTQAMAIEMCIERLSTHPAQRIADATGFPVTVDADGTARMWVNTDWRVLEAYEINGVWRCDNNFEDIDLDTAGWPDDNRPWQESIYRPRGV